MTDGVHLERKRHGCVHFYLWKFALVFLCEVIVPVIGSAENVLFWAHFRVCTDAL